MASSSKKEENPMNQPATTQATSTPLQQTLQAVSRRWVAQVGQNDLASGLTHAPKPIKPGK